MTGSSIGHYVIADKLGAGGMGEVWRARDPRLNRDVAIKILPPGLAADPERMARFEREAQVLASLSHPNIAVLHGLEISGDTRALVMELVEGETLSERIARGAIPVDEALPIARQIAEALESAHERGVIHRDLKPANVMLTPQGVVKLLDFGLAKALDDAPGDSKSQANSPTLSIAATRAGVLLGTAGYMSPEQVKGKAADKRADIWAFGVVMYEMLTGRQLYRGDTIADSLAQVIMTTPDTGVLPARVRSLVERCLEKEPRNRLRDIGEARIALEKPAKEEGPAEAGPRAKARPTWAVIAGILAIALAAVAFLHFREQPPTERQVRFTMALPANARVHSFAVSPDGQTLAISTGAPKSPILLRALNATDATPLPGTEDGTYPFWSPDSRYLAFFAQGKLRKIPVSGGPSLSLCDAPNGRGGSWNEDGEIVFAPGNTGPIHRVRAEGGVSTAITKPKGNNRFPVFVAGGRRFLYLDNFTGGSGGVYLGTLGETSARQILAEPSSVQFAPPAPGASHAHLLFIRENNLMAQPVDPETLEKAGEIFPAAEGVNFSTVLNFAPVSVSRSGVLVYLRGASLASMNLTWFDRSGRKLETLDAPPGLFRAVLAPDGKRIAAEVISADRSNIWLIDPQRRVNSQVSFREGRMSWPVWSPDGQRLLMAGSASGANAAGLFLKDVSGAGPEERILESKALTIQPTSWSAQGLLVYGEVNPGTNTDLKTLRMDGKSKPVTFLATQFREFLGRFSPDGRWMAYTSDETGSLEVYVRPVAPDGSAGNGKWKISASGGSGPFWVRDGKEIIYISTDGTVLAAPIRHLGAAIEPGTPQSLFEFPSGSMPGASGAGFRYQVSTDGQRFLTLSPKEEMGLPITVVVNWQAGLTAR